MADIELNATELFLLAKLLKRKLDKDERHYRKPRQVRRREELAAQGRADVAVLHIEKARALHQRLYAAAVTARDEQVGVMVGND